MPKHKKWIDKKHSKTFRLVPQSQNVDEYDDGHFQQTIGEKDVDEHHRCGIYFDDDYNYLQHLKKVDEVTKNEMERSIIKALPGKTNQLTNVFESNGYEISVEFLKMGTLPDEMHIDPDIIADVMSDDIDFVNLTNDLDDDFVLQASGGELPSLRPPIPFSLEKNEFREDVSDSGDDYNEESELDSNYDDDQISEENVFNPSPNKKKLRPIDKQFDKLCEEYFGTDGEETDEEEEKFLLDPNFDQLKVLAKDFKKKVELVFEKNALAQRYREIDGETLEAIEESEQITVVCPNRKKAKWDCETVVSTYSNIYNRPGLIVDVSRKRKLKPVLREIEKMDPSLIRSTAQSAISKVSLTTLRTRGETTEERKIRKAAVRMIRAERRAEKKCNKLAFKEERKKAAVNRLGSVKMLPIV